MICLAIWKQDWRTDKKIKVDSCITDLGIPRVKITETYLDPIDDDTVGADARK